MRQVRNCPTCEPPCHHLSFHHYLLVVVFRPYWPPVAVLPTARSGLCPAPRNFHLQFLLSHRPASSSPDTSPLSFPLSLPHHHYGTLFNPPTSRLCSQYILMLALIVHAEI